MTTTTSNTIEITRVPDQYEPVAENMALAIVEEVTDEETLLLQTYDAAPAAVKAVLYKTSYALRKAVEKRARNDAELREARRPIHERIASCHDALNGHVNTLVAVSKAVAELNARYAEIEHLAYVDTDDDDGRKRAADMRHSILDAAGNKDGAYQLAREEVNRLARKLVKLTAKPKDAGTSEPKQAQAQPVESYDVRGSIAAMYRVAYERGSERKRKIATNLLALSIHAFEHKDALLAAQVRAMRQTFASAKDDSERKQAVEKAAMLVQAAKLDANKLAQDYADTISKQQ